MENTQTNEPTKYPCYLCEDCEDWHYEGEHYYNIHLINKVKDGMRPLPTHRNWQYRCMFCKKNTIEYSRKPLSNGKVVFDVNGCRYCTPQKIAINAKVRFAAWERRGKYTLSYLTKNAIYTISKVKRQQHDTQIWLAEMPNYSFDVMSFTPVEFSRGDIKWLREKDEQEKSVNG